MQDSYNPMESYCFKIDLASLINKMPEPDRELCIATMRGKSIPEIAEQFHIHPRTARRRIKKSLAPLAAAYGIRGARRFLPLDTRLNIARERRGRKPGGVGSPAEASGFHCRGSNQKRRESFFFDK